MIESVFIGESSAGGGSPRIAEAGRFLEWSDVGHIKGYLIVTQADS